MKENACTAAKKQAVRSTLRGLLNATILATLVLISLKTDEVVGWPWYWLLVPLIAYFTVCTPCAIIAAIVVELKDD